MPLIAIAYAQGTAKGALPGTLRAFLDAFYHQIFNPIVFLLVAIAAVVFAWGIIEMIARADDEEAVHRGRKHAVSGIIGLFIMLSVWGILNLVCNLIGAC